MNDNEEEYISDNFEDNYDNNNVDKEVEKVINKQTGYVLPNDEDDDAADMDLDDKQEDDADNELEGDDDDADAINDDDDDGEDIEQQIVNITNKKNQSQAKQTNEAILVINNDQKDRPQTNQIKHRSSA